MIYVTCQEREKTEKKHTKTCDNSITISCHTSQKKLNFLNQRVQS